MTSKTAKCLSTALGIAAAPVLLLGLFQDALAVYGNAYASGGYGYANGAAHANWSGGQQGYEFIGCEVTANSNLGSEPDSWLQAKYNKSVYCPNSIYYSEWAEICSLAFAREEYHAEAEALDAAGWRWPTGEACME